MAMEESVRKLVGLALGLEWELLLLFVMMTAHVLSLPKFPFFRRHANYKLMCDDRVKVMTIGKKRT